MHILEVVIGLAFVFLLLSLACTALNELAAQWLNWRAATLREGINVLLGGGDRVVTPADAQKEVDTAESAHAAARTNAGAALLEGYDTAGAAKVAAESALASANAALRAARADFERSNAALDAVSARASAATIAAAQLGADTAATAVQTAEADVAAAAKAYHDARAKLELAEAELQNASPEHAKALRDSQAELDRRIAQLKVARLFQHPLIDGISQQRRKWWLFAGERVPSYIPARTFATALLDSLAPVASDGAAPLAELRRTVATLPEPLRRPLTLFIDDGAQDMERVRERVGRWYEDAMERVSGLYKRKTQISILLIGFAVAAYLNADSVAIARALDQNASLRQALVARAERTVADPPQWMRDRLRADSLARGLLPPAAPAGTDSATMRAATAAADSLAAARREFDAIIARIDSLGLPLGYALAPEVRAALDRATVLPTRDRPWWPTLWLTTYVPLVVQHLPGLLLTTLAVSLGAPFWFDMLNKVMNVRAAGRAPEERPKSPEALPPARGG